ncbi:four-helix bundle copper-binding protein [Trebonia kvetii]|uniref:Four-helix bundle copper-binding protein n=1 Tax=Trebonia kvetii TaxID=2480626 RepID=A0A6P2BVC8_9ACTN|nr:four-helix bundle copper-binding protein [Trebonia kvetii]TVZ02271.1 four-helix bundle copper-binding protein [Trebonia kvetii]
MSYARQLLDTYTGTGIVDVGVRAAAIDALSDCAQACIADIDADLSEHNVTDMVACIRLCLDCADVCTATIGVTSRQACGCHEIAACLPGRPSSARHRPQRRRVLDLFPHAG